MVEPDVLACPRCEATDRIQVVECRSTIHATPPGVVRVENGRPVPDGEFTFAEPTALWTQLRCDYCCHGWRAPIEPVTATAGRGVQAS